MPAVTHEKEAEILAALVRKCEAVDDCENVTAEENLLDSKQDFIAEICSQDSDGATVVSYCRLFYIGWRESETDGCDDDPVTFLRYSVRIFRQHTAKRADDTTPARDIKRLDINLKNAFRAMDRRLYDADSAPLANCESLPLAPQSDIILGVDALTGVYGYFRDYLLEIECL
jgi:hypothetical protein